MILEIDAGNTRIKWRVKGATQGAGALLGVVSNEQELFSELAALSKPSGIRLSSVRGPESTEAIRAWMLEKWQQEPELAVVRRSCAGVTNHYEDMRRLGVDRWLAMLAAFKKANGACVIVDAGTALTIDAVSKDGSHLGGYILPGANLMTRVLQDNTRIRLLDQAYRASTSLGHGTEAAVRNGIYASQVAVIEKVVRECREQGDAALYLAGGDAPVLAELLIQLNPEIVSDLVFDGLALACPGAAG